MNEAWRSTFTRKPPRAYTLLSTVEPLNYTPAANLKPEVGKALPEIWEKGGPWSPRGRGFVGAGLQGLERCFPSFFGVRTKGTVWGYLEVAGTDRSEWNDSESSRTSAAGNNFQPDWYALGPSR